MICGERETIDQRAWWYPVRGMVKTVSDSGLTHTFCCQLSSVKSIRFFTNDASSDGRDAAKGGAELLTGMDNVVKKYQVCGCFDA